MTLREPSRFPSCLRRDIEAVSGSAEVKQACREHTEHSGAKALDGFYYDHLTAKGYAVLRDRLLVAAGCKFDLDLLVRGEGWQAAVLIEGGKAARIDLDLLKFLAWGAKEAHAGPTYAVLIASDKKLLRNITGNPDEAAYDYSRRLRPLFSAALPQVEDLLVVEFDS